MLEAELVLLPLFVYALLVEPTRETSLEEIGNVKVSTVPFPKVVIEVPTSLAWVNPMQPIVVQTLWLAEVEETFVILLLALEATGPDPDTELEEAFGSEDMTEVVEDTEANDSLDAERAELSLETTDAVPAVYEEDPLSETTEEFKSSREVVGLEKPDENEGEVPKPELM